MNNNRILKDFIDNADALYRFVLLYGDYMKQIRNYGTEYDVTMIEVHLLTQIEENPGTTVTKQAEYWMRTKGAISQTLSKLIERGLVYKKPADYDAKTMLLYPTEAGKYLSKKHKEYDHKAVLETIDELKEQFTEKEIEDFIKVVNAYTEMLIEEKSISSDD